MATQNISIEHARHVMITHAKTEVAKGLIKKHAKFMLERMEDLGTVSRETRKIVLDELNDLAREIDELYKGA
jgi:3-methyladenine DNA glycosylase AlkD